jgi:hypothetical protein
VPCKQILMRHDRERLCDRSRSLNCLPNTFSISMATIRVKTRRLALRQHEIRDAVTMMTRWVVSFVLPGKYLQGDSVGFFTPREGYKLRVLEKGC